MKKKLFYDQNLNNYCVYVFFDKNNKRAKYVGAAANGRYATLLNRFKCNKNTKVYSILQNVTRENALYAEMLLKIPDCRKLKKRQFSKRNASVKLELIKDLKNYKKLKNSDFPKNSILIYLADSHTKNIEIHMMDNLNLYERSRFCWKLNNKKNQIEYLNKFKYAFVGYNKHIIAVYYISNWLEANSTQMFSRKQENSKNRYEFIGKEARELGKKFIGMYYFKNAFSHGHGLYPIK